MTPADAKLAIAIRSPTAIDMYRRRFEKPARIAPTFRIDLSNS
jgi:hypothetical protein